MINKEQGFTMLYRTRVLYNYFSEEVGLIKIFKKGTFHSFIKERGERRRNFFLNN
jgi:hypothetical protein